MKTATCCALALMFLATGFGASAGSLTPPGAPEPTMKTLTQVEPRTSIDGPLPYTISKPGSYYLTDSLGLSSEDTDGITITVSNVTLDLNGFTLTGQGKAAGTTGKGVYVADSTLSNITIRNGGLRNWRESGVFAVGLTPITQVVIENLRVDNSGFIGIRLGDQCRVSGCTSNDNAGPGISVDNGCILTNNVTNGNGAFMTLFPQFVLYAGGISAGNDCVITGNTSRNNVCKAIGALDSCVVTNNTATDSTCDFWSAYGITVRNKSTVSNNTCNGNVSSYTNAYGIRAEMGCTLSGNICTDNNGAGTGNGYGISTGDSAIVSGNNCGSNGAGCQLGIGISVAHNSTVRDNVCMTNLGTYSRGIDVQGAGCRITGNHCINNNAGFYTPAMASGSVYMNNYSRCTTVQFDILSAANYIAANQLTGTNNIAGGNTVGTGDLANVAF